MRPYSHDDLDEDRDEPEPEDENVGVSEADLIDPKFYRRPW